MLIYWKRRVGAAKGESGRAELIGKMEMKRGKSKKAPKRSVQMLPPAETFHFQVWMTRANNWFGLIMRRKVAGNVSKALLSV